MDILNTRVLIIDDEEMVRDNIEEILVPHKIEKNKKVDSAIDLLFDDEDSEDQSPIVKDSSHFPDFRVDKAPTGLIGFQMVEKAVHSGDPYAVIFLDMRMPGWDGLETAKRIRRVDTKVEIIIVTAFSDHSIDQIVSEAGKNVGYHVKPYNSEEILQIATKAVNDYNKLRNLEDLIDTTGKIRLGENQLNSLLRNIFDQLARYMGTDNAIMGTLNENDELDFLHKVGSMGENLNLEALLNLIRKARHNNEAILQEKNIVLALLQDYPVFALLEPNETLKTEKVYLLQLFIQNATQAIQNAHLQEELLKKEKLSAAGKALGMLMHDLRTPIKNIPQITDLLRGDGASEELLQLLDESSKQASEILDDFLDFVREAPIKKNKVSLKDIAERALSLAENRRSLEGIEIKMDVNEQVQLAGDSSKLKRVLMNIISNAADALLDLGVEKPCIDISSKTEGQYEIISIRDNGPGIPEDIMQKLFEPFTTKNKKEGTGLGLSIVKQYVEAHDGQIEVHNDNGAVFEVKLEHWQD